MSAPASGTPEITIRQIRFADLYSVLSAGWSDFLRAPTFGVFFGAVYAIGGWLLIASITVLEWPWMAYPLVVGFALIGPFVATGLYEVSRRIEVSEPLTWRGILTVVHSQHRRELGWMAFVMLFVFWIWMYQVRTLVAVFFGLQGFATFSGFLEAVLTTANGWAFLAVGHLIGAVISLALFAITVVSCPLLLDRDVDFVTAMMTSIRSVAASPRVMLTWGIFVVLSVLLTALTALVGLVVVLPVLGHATWHLYRHVVRVRGADGTPDMDASSPSSK